MEIVNLEPEVVNWWENKNNFPCILIDDTRHANALVWVHYQEDGVAYDCRDFGYKIDYNTNWRRATKEEILNNIKGL